MRDIMGRPVEFVLWRSLVMSRPKYARLLAAGLAVAVGLTVAACSGGAEKTKTPGGYTVELIDAKKLTVCTNIPYVPFQFEKDGKTVGFDVDMVDLAADELGVKQDVIDVKWDNIENGSALSGGKCDLAAAAMTITPEREKNLTFSDPYFDEVIAFVAPKGKAPKSVEDVGDRKLGVQASTTSLDYAEKHKLEPQEFEDSAKQRAALESGKVDVVLQDYPVITEWMKDEKFAAKYEVGQIIETGSQYGFGFKKSADKTLVKVVNEQIKKAKDSKKYDELYKKWFGTEPKAS